jgi:hypothetical protein
MTASVWTGTAANIKTPELQQRMNEDNKLYMMQGLLRLPEMFELAKGELKPEHFNIQSESAWSILWRAAIQVAANNNGKLPDNEAKARTLIELEATKLADGAPSNVVGGGGADELFYGPNDQPGTGLIDEIYTSRTQDVLDPDATRSLLKVFLTEREIFDPLQRFVNSIGNNSVPTSADKIITKLQTSRDKIEGLGVDPVEDAFTSSWESNAIVQVPTDMAFLDNAMDGGPALGEVIVILGPTGGGKTMLGIMAAVNGARYQVQLAKKGEPSGYWFYFTYESPVNPDIRSRVMSYAAQINFKETMKTLKSLDQLSTSDNLKDYEKKRWEASIRSNVPVPGERERYEQQVEQIGDRLKLVDMSGKDNPAVGSKGIEEISRVLQTAVNKGQQPIGIIIDYAGLLVERYMAARNEKVENEFAYLNRFVNNVRVQIAGRFNCICWVLHQLHGDAGAASPTARQHHSKARGARNFADNANFAFNIGTKDESNNCCIISCTKHRRADGVKEPPIVRIDGQFGAMSPEDATYALDASQQRIVEKKTKELVVDNIDPTRIGRKPFNVVNKVETIE